MFVCAHLRAGTLGARAVALDPHKAGVTSSGKPQTWVLGSKLRASEDFRFVFLSFFQVISLFSILSSIRI